MAAGGHFEWLKITFDRISRHFRSIRNFDFCSQNGCRQPFWMTENHFRSHFSPFQINTQVFLFFFTKWLPAAILDDWKPLSIAFLTISDQYATFIFVDKFAAGSHFGRPKITFDRISRHFRSIRNFDFCSQNGCWRPFWMTENHFRSHFSPFQINTQLLFFLTNLLPAAILEDRKSLSIAFSRHFRSISNFFVHKTTGFGTYLNHF